MTQAALNALVTARLPSSAFDSTVAIVMVHEKSIHQIGSGVLFQIADARFVVTAAHVLNEPSACGKTVGFSGGGNALVAAGGDWIVSAKAEPGQDVATFDIAVYRIPDAAVPRLAGASFLRAPDVESGDQLPSAVFAILGYPGAWSLSGTPAGDDLVIKPFQYIAHSYYRDVAGLAGYDPRYHILIDAQDRNLTDPDGYSTYFAGRAGEELTLSKGLKGTSGCGVWVIGDINAPLNLWHAIEPRLVGLGIGTYSASEVIIATRWSAVTTLIHRAFPDLRASIATWLP